MWICSKIYNMGYIGNLKLGQWRKLFICLQTSLMRSLNIFRIVEIFYFYYKLGGILKIRKFILERRAVPVHCYRTNPGRFKWPQAHTSATGHVPYLGSSRHQAHGRRLLQPGLRRPTNRLGKWSHIDVIIPSPINRTLTAKRTLFFSPFLPTTKAPHRCRLLSVRRCSSWQTFDSLCS
jgi:hypothetical protein